MRNIIYLSLPLVILFWLRKNNFLSVGVVYMDNPLVSVLLPVYNGERFLIESISSILNQTFNDFELIIINDGSTDKSIDILNSIDDARVSVINQLNTGLPAALNLGISLAKGKYIARQDQDDVSMLDRFAKQVNYLEHNLDCALLGTSSEIWEVELPSGRYHDHPCNAAELCFDLIFNNPFVHSSVMIRKNELLLIGGYSLDLSRQPPEDYELWSRISRASEVANLPERLLAYREVPQSMSRSGPNPFLDKLVLISSENLANACGFILPNTICTDFAALTHSAYHKISSNPDIGKICELVDIAATNISVRFPQHNISGRSEYRIKNLRHQYLIYKTNLTGIRKIGRAVRSALKKLKLC